MSDQLQNKKVAILATEGFEYVELVKPKQALEQAGAKTEVISPKEGKIKGWNIDDWGDDVTVDLSLDKASPENYDALLLPGGVMNPDKLRQEPKAVQFVKAFLKPESRSPPSATVPGCW